MSTGAGAGDDIKWLTVADVARKLDLKTKTVYLLASEHCPADRRIASHRLGPNGGKLRFHPDDVADYIESRRSIVKSSPQTLRYLRPKVAGSTGRRS